MNRINLNMKINARFSYWQIFKHAWDILGMWIHFFNCHFYEIPMQTRYVEKRLTFKKKAEIYKEENNGHLY